MLERTLSLHFLIVVSCVGACSIDRATSDFRNVTAGTTGTGGGPPPDASGADAPSCAYLQMICDGNYAKVCDGQGAFTNVRHCKSECKDGLGCIECVANTGTCDGPTKLATACDATGTYTVSFACDGDNMTCDPDGCHGVCSPATLGMGNVGCDFWSTVTPTSVWGSGQGAFRFGVVIGNTSATAPADVKITVPGLPDETLTIMPNAVATKELPWVNELKGDDWQVPYQPKSPTHSVNATRLLSVSAYHIVSNQPIVAYQFSPLDTNIAASPGCPALSAAQIGFGCFAYSSDASLLLPTHALFNASYVVTGYHGWHQDPFPPMSTTPGQLDMGDFVSITATQPIAPTGRGTIATLVLRNGQNPLTWADGTAVSSRAPISMGPGQVLQVFSKGTSVDETLSGMQILSDLPIQVLSGVNCASIPLNPAHCSHMEESLVPKEALGKDYVVPALLRSDAKVGAHTIRVQAVDEKTATAVAFEPPLLTAVTLSTGDVVEIPDVSTDVRISANVPFAVTQFVHGPGAKDEPKLVAGPNQVTVVATSQFKTSYAFAAAPTYEPNYVSIVAPTGATVSLDGQTIASALFTAVGASGMSVARWPVPLPSNDRLHVVTADKPVGVIVNGFAPYASYAYPAGLDLRHVPAAR
jgi:hypothetical protein